MRYEVWGKLFVDEHQFVFPDVRLEEPELIATFENEAMAKVFAHNIWFTYVNWRKAFDATRIADCEMNCKPYVIEEGTITNDGVE